MKTITATLVLSLCICTAEAAGSKRIREKRAWIIDSFNIEEESPGPFPYLLGTIELDRKYLVNFGLRGSGVDQDPVGVLDIDQKNGRVMVNRKVDYESHQILKLVFEARNQSNNQVDTRLGVEIKILDINDHAPIFQRPTYKDDVEESLTQGSTVLTVMATDKDDSQTPNGTFGFRIVSVTPKKDNVEFYLTSSSTVGVISFKGCLDYEKAKSYQILVEAKDNGPKVQLSSTSTVTLNVVDKNNHLPVITGQRGPGKIKERESGVEVLRLIVFDKDSNGSDAWRAKFKIHGDNEGYFKIETDPVTNEGILTVLKPMDYEEQTSRNVSISVENEVPYFSCVITNRPPTGLWGVKTEGPETGAAAAPKLYPVTISVEDVNDPPEFVPPVQRVTIMENSKAGTPLCTFKAVDPDKTFGSTFHFTKGEDVDDWITVDPKTGEVVTAKVLDRESPFYKNSSYNVLLYVVDNGEPPMTGTGTLIIQVGDQNDNTPVLDVNSLSMCLSDKPTSTNISAVDLDLPPYSGPFKFELLGDVKGKWKLDPTYGTTVDLVKDGSVYSGIYHLQLLVSDSQGISSEPQNLTITVCDCSVSQSCHERRASKAILGAGALGIMAVAFFLLLAILLMVFLMSCKQEKNMIVTVSDEGPGWRLLESNIEIPGTDCKVPSKMTEVDSHVQAPLKRNDYSQKPVFSGASVVSADNLENAFLREQLIRRSLRRSSTRRSQRSYRSTTESRNYSLYSVDVFHLRQSLSTQINKRLLKLQAPGEELEDYKPHCYAYEGEPMTDTHLDAIPLPENDFHPDALSNLDLRFNKLATICSPDLMS
ncbi:cadherin-like protein 26 isoform X2 [Hoplias malabaricus]|uniref:cadherin-like protein 26 isoform X2 n=1 Tax=Hoplias malabaricus TaxID=27720 RepID=UPI003462807D